MAAAPPSPVSARRQARHVTVFLDVDGVLNSYPVPTLRIMTEGRKKLHAWNYELHYRPAVIAFFDRIVETHEVDVVWLSTWSQRCKSELEPKFGLRNSFEVIEMPDETHNRYAADPQLWWKAKAMEEWLAVHEHGRAIWIDDDLAWPATREYFQNRYSANRLKLIAPDFSHGLTKAHLKEIRGFAYPKAGDPKTARPKASGSKLAGSRASQTKEDA
ncbi:HAD domain-containing protein [Brevibacterium renqingii]|uniref:HAD domain-containing protein n=1 Tax=Brevibacterium renqingii TaxID=2776916 RepID=UPI001AE08B76|nr:HAD domain-containing protein [Brevibacterium renqingii]